ncbi:MAG: hypothetical protein JWL95_1995 [Gemmatimonadetes bacterium]|nr:hypothetical protein [Gemmatimonadota bacterium]
MTKRRFVLGTIAAVALLLALGRWGSERYTDYLWYASLGAQDVWRAQWLMSTTLWVGSFLAAAAFAFVNFYTVRQSVVSLVLPRRIANIEIGEEVPGRYLLLATIALSMLLGAALTLPSDSWSAALLARTGRAFGESDPYFGADLGFFVYWLPFETTLFYWAMIVLLVVIMLVIVLYALTPSLRWTRGTLYVSAYVRRHFTMLGGILLLALAWSYRLGMYRLLADGGGDSGAFTAVDHRVTVPATLVLALVTLCAALIVLWAGWSGQMRLAFFAVSAVLLLSLVARTVAPLVARRSVDPIAATAQEQPYVATRLTYTRRAYAVNAMRADSLGTGFAAPADLNGRVGIWDAGTLGRATERTRHVEVVGTGAAWIATPTGLAALLVERGNEGVSDGREFWDVGRFDAVAADERGQPIRAPASSRFGDETVLDEPAVYDSAPGYTIVADSLQRIAGVEMVSTASRLAHAWSLQNFRLLLGDLPLDRPTILRHRSVRDRIRALAPFFVQGSEILPVVADDSLYWALELYVASDDYPLAERFQILNAQRGYFQHAATAIIHATSGRVRMLPAAAPEAVTASWIANFPSLFVRPSALSPALQAALPPILDGAHAQALAFSVAGFRGDSLEVRHFATPDAADSAVSREPSHALLPALGVSALWTLLDSAERVRGVIAAVGGGSRATRWIPLATDGQRWGAMVDRLRAVDSVSHEAAIVRTPVRVMPVNGKPLYLQAGFRWRAGASPQLARVAIVAGDSARSGPTLATALGLVSKTAGLASATPGDTRTRAEALYTEMRDALRRGDWGAFGRAFDALGASLRVPVR